MSYCVLFTIFLVQLATVIGNVDYRLVRDTSPSKVCEKLTAPGYTCKNCTSLVFCQNVSDGLVEKPVGACPNGKICVENRCVVGTRCPFPDVQFVCSTRGVFPDPSTCTKYHICIEVGDKLNHYQVTCESSQNSKYGFNPEKVACSDALPANGQCQTNYVPVCKFIFDVGVIPRTSIYYECSYYIDSEGNINTDILYPYQSRCPNGKVYNIAAGECR